MDVHSLYMTLDFYNKPDELHDIDANEDLDIELEYLDEIEELSDEDLREIDYAAQ